MDAPATKTEPSRAPGDSGDQSVLGVLDVRPDIHESKAAGAVGVLRFAGREAGLTEEGRLLVPRRPRHGDGTAEPLRVRIAKQTGGGTHFGQDAFGHVQFLQYFVVPLQIPDVEHQRTGGVGIVGLVDLALGKLPHEPTVYVAEEDLPSLRPLPDPGHVLQDPADLGAGEVGVDDQAGLFAEGIHQALGLQTVTVFGCAAALPDNGVADGLAGDLIPDDGAGW